VPSGDDPDERSIFVKNVHFSATVDDLKEHFSDCGEINRVTIPVDKMSGKSKG
jgi:polyadenylate-binding protein 2